MILYVTVHPSREEWAEGYAQGLESGSDGENTYEVVVSEYVPIDTAYVSIEKIGVPA